MKNINLFICFLAISFIWSCEDNREADMEPTKLYMAQSGIATQIVYELGETYKTQVSVIKSGIYDVPAIATIAVQEDELLKYNEKEKTNYKMMPENCYTLTETTVNIGSSDGYKNIPVIINVTNLKKLPEKGIEYVIPIGITEANTPINEQIKTTFLNFELEPAIVSLDKSGEQTLPSGEGDTITIEIPISVPFDNQYNITCEFSTDKSVFDEYNETKEGAFVQLSVDAFSILEQPFVIEQGETSKTLKIELYRNKLGTFNYAFVMKLIDVSNDSGQTIIPDSTKNTYITVVSNLVDFDSAGWVLTSDHTYNNGAGGADGLSPSVVIDGDLGTYWHSDYSTGTPPTEAAPVWFDIDMGKDNNITGIKIAPRSKDANHVQNGYIETSPDNVVWTKVGSFKTEGRHELQAFSLTSTTARYVRVNFTGGAYGMVSEIVLQGGE